MSRKVDFTDYFTEQYDRLTTKEQDLIDDFVFFFETIGLKHSPYTPRFTGKISSTENVPHGVYDRAAKIAYARRHRLWHVHIGWPHWNPSRNHMANYKTSNYVVHFQKINDSYIALVGYDCHNPMRQPEKHRLFTQF